MVWVGRVPNCTVMLTRRLWQGPARAPPGREAAGGRQRRARARAPLLQGQDEDVRARGRRPQHA